MRALKDLRDYNKPGMWLAVITQKQKMKVVAAAKNPKKALQEAIDSGFGEAALIQSATHYAAWIM